MGIGLAGLTGSASTVGEVESLAADADAETIVISVGTTVDGAGVGSST